MARQNFKPGTLTAPLPAVMVSVGDMEESNIITIGWTGILSSDPPRTYISVRPSRYSHKLLMKTGEFVINLTNEPLALATDYAGVYTGEKVDKFEKCHLTRVESKCVKAPTIKESPLALECKVYEVVHSGTHDIFFADIVSVSCDDKIIDENGRICFDRARLIAYAHGEYYTLGKKIGKFGFSTDKKNQKNGKIIEYKEREDVAKSHSATKGAKRKKPTAKKPFGKAKRGENKR